MACDRFFEKSAQSRIVPTPSNSKKDPVLYQPHQLVGTEIWLQDQYQQEEKIFLEGVTKIEFREGEISFHTILGDEIRLRGEIKKSLLLEKGFVFELEHSPIAY